VKNLAAINLYVKTTNDSNGFGDGIHLWGSNDRVTNSMVHDMKQGISIDYLNTQSGGEIDHNLGYNNNWCFTTSDRNASSSSTGMLIHNNVCHDWANWDNPAQNDFHHNGVFVIINNDTAWIAGLQVYSNYFYGDVGVFMTGNIFLDSEGNGSGSHASYDGTVVFNNLFVNSSTIDAPSNAQIIAKANGGNPAVSIYNNTFVYQPSSKGRCIMNQGAVLAGENNTGSQCSLAYYNSAGTISLSDYNDWYAAGGNDATEGSHSIVLNPLLTGVYTLGVGSPAIGAAQNLTPLSIIPLDSDLAGISRPSSGPWDIGAYQYVPPPSGGVRSGPTVQAGPTVKQ